MSVERERMSVEREECEGIAIHVATWQPSNSETELIAPDAVKCVMSVRQSVVSKIHLNQILIEIKRIIK